MLGHLETQLDFHRIFTLLRIIPYYSDVNESISGRSLVGLATSHSDGIILRLQRHLQPLSRV